MSEPLRPGECGDDVAAYALGALEPAEAEAFRVHLETCAACREELGAFQPVADALPLAAPARRAPARLRRRVLAEVRPAATPARSARLGALAAGWLRPALAALAVLAVAAVIAVRLGSGPPSRLYPAHGTAAGQHAELRVSAGRGRLVLTHFAPPPSGEVYEVWVKRGERPPQPTDALFSVTRSGSAEVAVPGEMRRGTTVMVTPEPPGGSRAPTHPPVLIVSVD